VFPSPGATAAGTAIHYLLFTVNQIRLNFKSQLIDLNFVPEIDGISTALFAFAKFDHCAGSVSPAAATSTLVPHRWHARIVPVVHLFKFPIIKFS
jgi:hypothetical protein